jgi:hypothetical protein
MSDVKVTGICRIISMEADHIDNRRETWQPANTRKSRALELASPAEATREVFGTGRDFGTRAKGP